MKKLIYVLIFVLISCSSETYISELPIVHNPDINESENRDSLVVHNYLALGDSYTIGEGVNEEERWPVQLVKHLALQKYLVNEPVILANAGWTTANLNAAIYSEDITDTFDIVTILIGVNNQYQGGSIVKFQNQFSELLSKAIIFAKNKPENVIVVSIPDWGVSPFGNSVVRGKISKEIDAFNTVKKEETLKMNAKFVDITPISRLALNNSEFIASDSLHFSGEMYKLWVEEIIRKCFRNK
jgi:lysophospholipase L1-like esterase